MPYFIEVTSVKLLSQLIILANLNLHNISTSDPANLVMLRAFLVPCFSEIIGAMETVN